ncbi:hypothetical protein BHE74_00016203 [Ensete ventricosum]|nr:hypothetical protein BHE74_00016203 [Ensete ventricosum]
MLHIGLCYQVEEDEETLVSEDSRSSVRVARKGQWRPALQTIAEVDSFKLSSRGVPEGRLPATGVPTAGLPAGRLPAAGVPAAWVPSAVRSAAAPAAEQRAFLHGGMVMHTKRSLSLFLVPFVSSPVLFFSVAIMEVWNEIRSATARPPNRHRTSRSAPPSSASPPQGCLGRRSEPDSVGLTAVAATGPRYWDPRLSCAGIGAVVESREGPRRITFFVGVVRDLRVHHFVLFVSF